mgnify:FL=1
MADLVSSMVGGTDGSGAPRMLMIGDRPETDGLFARRLGCRFALVRSGVTPAGSASPHGAELRVDADAPDLAEVARRLLRVEREAQ